MQSSQLRGGVAVITSLQVRIDEIFDRVAELVPDELSFIAGGILQSCIRCAQVAPNYSRPIAQARVDVRRHVERMWIVRRDQFVLARDLK